jgi:hypothetical protein
MLGLPQATEVNRRVAKEKLYANATLSTQVRDAIKDQIEAVYWRNKLADSTVGIGAGEEIKEIQVFEIQLRRREIDKRILTAIAKAIPYKILFMLIHNEETQAWIEVEGTFYNTDWLPHARVDLKFEGLNLDAVYANLARQISGGRLGKSGNIGQAVEDDKRRQKLERDIATLGKRLMREKQFNRQVEMSGELKRLKKDFLETVEKRLEFAKQHKQKNKEDTPNE